MWRKQDRKKSVWLKKWSNSKKRSANLNALKTDDAMNPFYHLSV